MVPGRRISGTRSSAVFGALDEAARVIVLAEDEEDLRIAMAEVLTDLGFVVVDVATAALLRRALTKVKPWAVILDLNLGPDTSESVLAELTAERVLLVSAAVDAREIAERHGVAFLPKPFELDALLALLGDAPRTDAA